MEFDNVKIGKDTIKYLIGTFTSNIINIFQNIFLARVLGPSSFGVWNLLMVVLTYNQNGHFGLIHGMTKEIPILRGKNKPEAAKLVEEVSFSAICFLEILLVLIVFCISFFKLGNFPQEFYFGLKIIALIMMVSQVYIFLSSIFRNDMKFSLLSYSWAALPALTIFLITTGFFFFGCNIEVALWALLISNLITVWYMVVRGNFRFSFVMNFDVLFGLFKTGLPLIIYTTGFTVFLTVDRWVIGKMLGAISLGYYSIGSIMIGMLYTVPAVLASVLYPRMLQAYGKDQTTNSALNIIYKPILVFAFLMIWVIGVIAIMISTIIVHGLPSYIPGITPIIILIFGSYFFSLTSIIGNYLISINLQNILLKIQFVSIILLLLCDYLAIKAGYGLTGVAVCSAVIYFCYGLAILLNGFKLLFLGMRRSLLVLFKMFILYLACILYYFFVSKNFGQVPGSLFGDIFVTGVKISGFSIYLAIIIVIVYGYNNVFFEVKSNISRALKIFKH